MVKIKPNTYYLDFERHLYYVIGRKDWEPNQYGSMAASSGKAKDQGWEVLDLSTNKKHHMDLETWQIILTVELGADIPPAMRLLYGAANI